jgi:hypothetical protein
MPLQATSGAASYDGFGGGVPVVPNYIEEVFSTQVYTGSGTSKTITNNIDLSTKGGLVWTKLRASPNSNGPNHRLSDSAIGVNQVLSSNNTDPKTSSASFGISAFNSDGYTITNPGGNGGWNYTNDTFVSWTFRKQPKFFDVVTYTGTGSVQNISHNLGSAPGCIIVKDTTNAGSNWAVYHRSLNEYRFISLNLTTSETISSGYWNNTAPTSTQFTVGTNGNVNQSGATFVAYLFAHDAGGFGLLGTDNVITCGQFDTNGAGNATVDLGYEPQWVMTKRRDSTGSWAMFDSMRRLTVAGSNDGLLFANGSDAEDVASYIGVTSTGLAIASGAYSPSASYIYIAIRRGPMKVPTVGTSVFKALARTGDRLAGSLTGIGFNPDSLITLVKTGSYQHEWNNKLAGSFQLLRPTTNESEFTSTDLKSYDQDGISFNATDFNSNINRISPLIQYFLKRAPSVFDIVCYTGTGTNTNLTHNLGVVPEMLITKRRSNAGPWVVYTATTGNTNYLQLYTTDAVQTNTDYYNSTTPTSSVFTLGSSTSTNATAQTFVAYLFATCPGVSKVGTYTGTGALQTVNCGFTSGARFILIKRTDSTGSWWLYDSERGISSSDDPYLFLNSNGAEVTNTNYVDTDTTGFKVTAAAPADLNASGGSYIFLAIA